MDRTSFKYLVFLLAVFANAFVNCSEDSCMSVLRQLLVKDGEQLGPQSACGICESRPGKRGPEGPKGSPGPPGGKGDPGSCQFDVTETQRLKEEVDRLKTRIKSRIPDFCYLGVSTFKVPITAITASSTHPDCPIDLVRLHSRRSWCSSRSSVGQWVQVDLGASRLVSGIVTQGRADYNQWVTKFKISYGNSESSLNTMTEWGREKTFNGNGDRGTPVKNLFPQPVTARYLRIYPVKYAGHMSMRLDLLDC